VLGVISLAIYAPKYTTVDQDKAEVAELVSSGKIARVDLGATSPGGWQPWSAAAVTRAQSAGRPILVDFTAKWCLSCQVNERAALAQPEVEKALQDSNVLLLKADWTRYDDAITQALKSMGRSGVPAYALYSPGQSQPELLPEVLTPGIVIDAVSKLPKTATARAQ